MGRERPSNEVSSCRVDQMPSVGDVEASAQELADDRRSLLRSSKAARPEGLLFVRVEPKGLPDQVAALGDCGRAATRAGSVFFIHRRG